MMQEPSQYLARVLKQERQTRQWSLDRTARETGVSKAMLGQIERGESSPTLATLWKIATGFHTSLSHFLEPPATENSTRDKPLADNNPFVHRIADTLRHKPATDDMLVAPLFPFEQRFGFEVLELTLQPGYQRLSEPHDQGVTEHVIVIQGEMELLTSGNWMSLPKGAAVRFAADQPHGYRNHSDQPAVFYNLIHYP